MITDIGRLLDEMNDISWWHHIPLPGLGLTPGKEPSPRLRDGYMRLPADLSGKKVLDIGAWDGLYSFVAEERGASKVVAVDLYDKKGTQAWGTLFPSRRGIEFAKMVRKSNISIYTADLHYLTRGLFGHGFDVIFFFGVLYHLQDPIGALRKLHHLLDPDGLLITETALDLLTISRPACAFYPGAENGKDPTNWFCPNIACTISWLSTAGFRDIEFTGGIGLDQSVSHETVQYGRGAFHAYKRDI